MNSRSISIFAKSVVASCVALLSTEKPIWRTLWSRFGQSFGGRQSPDREEDSLLPRAWLGSTSPMPSSMEVRARAERKESERYDGASDVNSNRKETRNPAFLPLLNRPNTSRIRPFTDRLRQQNAATGEVVMDRGAERAAGGCDVI